MIKFQQQFYAMLCKSRALPGETGKLKILNKSNPSVHNKNRAAVAALFSEKVRLCDIHTPSPGQCPCTCIQSQVFIQRQMIAKIKQSFKEAKSDNLQSIVRAVQCRCTTVPVWGMRGPSTVVCVGHGLQSPGPQLPVSIVPTCRSHFGKVLCNCCSFSCRVVKTLIDKQ